MNNRRLFCDSDRGTSFQIVTTTVLNNTNLNMMFAVTKEATLYGFDCRVICVILYSK